MLIDFTDSLSSPTERYIIRFSELAFNGRSLQMVKHTLGTVLHCVSQEL